MATGAGLAEWKQTHGKKKAKCVLTSTGLLMEGVGQTPMAICRCHPRNSMLLGCRTSVAQVVVLPAQTRPLNSVWFRASKQEAA